MSEPLATAISRGIQRRMRARHLYRVRRDRKIAVDYIGKWFELKIPPELPNRAVDWLRMQLSRYNSNNHMVHFHTKAGELSLSTDDFWSAYRVGNVRDAA